MSTDPEGTEDLFDEFFRRDRDHERDRHRSRVLTEFVRRAVEGAVGQVQQSGAVPREALSFLLHQGDKGKREVVRIVANEVGDFLRHVDISSEVLKVLTSVQMDVNASIRFRRHGDGIRPEISHDSRVEVSEEDSGPDLSVADADADAIDHEPDA